METSSTAFLLIAHGSRLQEANLEVQKLAHKLSVALQKSVMACFLELAEPSISGAIDSAVAEGAKKIKILPYFLSGGRHVQQDIPQIIQAKIAQYPQIRFDILDYFGRHILLREALLKIFKNELS